MEIEKSFPTQQQQQQHQQAHSFLTNETSLKKRKYENILNGIHDNDNNDTNNNTNNIIQTVPTSSRFLFLSPSNDIYHAENTTSLPFAQNKQEETIYVPLQENTFVNPQAYEEIVFRNGTFFLANQNGVYEKTNQGVSINFLKHCSTERKMYIARSFVFTNTQKADEIGKTLLNL